MDRKIQLLTALAEAEKSVKTYAALLHSAEKAEREIRSELNDGFTPGSSRYSHGDLASVKRKILNVLSASGTSVAPRVLVDAIPEHHADLILRELHKLSKDQRSNVVWNGRKGAASSYRRY